jgi:hypothetical protein
LALKIYNPFLVNTIIPSPNGRVYVNWPEGNTNDKHWDFNKEDKM